jgi:hypothetical protein
VNLSTVFAGQNVGVTQVGGRIWLVTVMRSDLGYFDDETCRLERIDYPFTAKCYVCPRNEPEEIGSSGWIRTNNPPVNSQHFQIHLGRSETARPVSIR